MSKRNSTFTDPLILIALCPTRIPDMNIYDEYVEGINCPVYAGFFGVMGATAAIVFSCEFPAIPQILPPCFVQGTNASGCVWGTAQCPGPDHRETHPAGGLVGGIPAASTSGALCPTANRSGACHRV